LPGLGAAGGFVGNLAMRRAIWKIAVQVWQCAGQFGKLPYKSGNVQGNLENCRTSLVMCRAIWKNCRTSLVMCRAIWKIAVQVFALMVGRARESSGGFN
jgi:hypothetical protein